MFWGRTGSRSGMLGILMELTPDPDLCPFSAFGDVEEIAVIERGT